MSLITIFMYSFISLVLNDMLWWRIGGMMAKFREFYTSPLLYSQYQRMRGWMSSSRILYAPVTNKSLSPNAALNLSSSIYSFLCHGSYYSVLLKFYLQVSKYVLNGIRTRDPCFLTSTCKGEVKGKVITVLNQVPRHEDVLGEWRCSTTNP